eukprot:scaffold46306_cov13-Prasinocladus_malaysianus.AAC.2
MSAVCYRHNKLSLPGHRPGRLDDSFGLAHVVSSLLHKGDLAADVSSGTPAASCWTSSCSAFASSRPFSR